MPKKKFVSPSPFSAIIPARLDAGRIPSARKSSTSTSNVTPKARVVPPVAPIALEASSLSTVVSTSITLAGARPANEHDRMSDAHPQKLEISISILDRPPSNRATANSPEKSSPRHTRGSTPEGGLSKTIADNLYMTLAVLVEAFVEAKKNTAKYGSVDQPNADAIGKALQARAEKAFSPDPAKGQSAEAIRKRIAEAMRPERRLADLGTDAVSLEIAEEQSAEIIGDQIDEAMRIKQAKLEVLERLRAR